MPIQPNTTRILWVEILRFLQILKKQEWGKGNEKKTQIKWEYSGKEFLQFSWDIFFLLLIMRCMCTTKSFPRKQKSWKYLLEPIIIASFFFGRLFLFQLLYEYERFFVLKQPHHKMKLPSPIAIILACVARICMLIHKYEILWCEDERKNGKKSKIFDVAWLQYLNAFF